MLFLFVFAFSNLSAQKQSKGTITGIIVDNQSKQPIEFANVVIQKESDNTQINGTITDAKGKFSLNKIAYGKYKIVYSFIGFEQQETPLFTISEQNRTVNAGILGLSVSNQEIKDAVVVGERSTYTNSIDRKVFNVGKDVIGKTGSVSDLMQNVPSLSVDIDGNLSLRGSDNVIVLINGKPSAMMGTNRAAVLQQMPANSIERIEVITNPSAKFKPDGTSGIINIVLKKNKGLGLNGTIMANAGNDNRYNGNIAANYNTGKVNVFGSYSVRQDDRLRYTLDSRKRTDLTTNVVDYTNMDANEKSRPISNIINSGIDFKINDNNQIGISGNYNHRDQNKTGLTNTRNEDQNHLMTKDLDRNRIDPEFEHSFEYTANYRHSFEKEGHELTVDYTSSSQKEQEDNHYTNVFRMPVQSTTYDNTLIKQDDNESQFSVEYSNPLSETSKFESGYILETRKNDMNFYGENFNPVSNAWEKDFGKSNQFIYNEDIHVFYSTFEQKFGKFGVLGGLRAEQAMVKSHQITTDSLLNNNYFKLYPSLHLSYNMDDAHELQLNYSHRIRRPEGDDLNPFPEYQDPYNLRIGNPRLKPEETHSVEFGYQYKNKLTTITSTLYYRYTYNGMTSLTKYLNDSVLVTTRFNLSKNSSAGFEFIVATTLAKIINVNFSSNTFYNTIDASSLGYSSNKSNISFLLNLNSSVNLTKSTMAQFTSNYVSERLTPQGKQLPSFVMNMGFRHEFLKKKAAFIFTVSDVFNTLKNKSVLNTPELYQNVIRRRSARIIYAGISYTFGKQLKKSKENTLKFDNQL
ncbi:MAG: TonB-dependent receptor [Mariniphaga sp.]|nr:TonB-dependent receptor [Mariniphaga sp.]